MATCIAAHFALSRFLMKNQKIGKNRFLVFLNGLFLFRSVIFFSLLLFFMNQGRTKGECWSTAN